MGGRVSKPTQEFVDSLEYINHNEKTLEKPLTFDVLFLDFCYLHFFYFFPSKIFYFFLTSMMTVSLPKFRKMENDSEKT